MPEKKSTIGTNQGRKPELTGEPVSHEDEASAGPHDTDQQVVININPKEGQQDG